MVKGCLKQSGKNPGFPKIPKHHSWLLRGTESRGELTGDNPSITALLLTTSVRLTRRLKGTCTLLKGRKSHFQHVIWSLQITMVSARISLRNAAILALWATFPSCIRAVPTAEVEIQARQDADNHWVATWTSMPQQVEDSNMPPSPFVRTSQAHQRRFTN